MSFMFYDPTMILLIPAILLALWAQFKVKNTFNKYQQVPAGSGYTGADVARRLLDENGLSTVLIEEVPGNLSDHYDPKAKRLRLSSGTARSRSVAAIGVAAHEVGHAIQDSQAYGAFQVRHMIFPVANLGSTLAFPFFFIGILFTIPQLMDIGIILFAAAVLFQVVTLPVEFNASSRALAMLKNRGYLQHTEVKQAKSVLDAAALTYVAATAMAVLSLLRLLILRDARD